MKINNPEWFLSRVLPFAAFPHSGFPAFPHL